MCYCISVYYVYRRSLLPTVHKQWPPLMTRLKALRHIFIVTHTIHTTTTPTHKQSNATVNTSKLTGKVNLLLNSTTTSHSTQLKGVAEPENSGLESHSATSFSDLMRPISTTQYSTNKSIRRGGSSSVRESEGVMLDSVDRQQLHLLPPLLVSNTISLYQLFYIPFFPLLITITFNCISHLYLSRASSA